MNFETVTNQETSNHNPLTTSPTEPSPIVEESTDSSPAIEETVEQSFDEYLANGYDYKAPKRGDILTGEIIDSNDYGLVVDIGFKREGFVPAEDLTRLDEETRAQAQVGTKISLFVLRPENKDGHPILSIHQARMYKDWIKAEEMLGSGEIYEGEVAGYNRGGIIVKFGKIRGFVPASQIVGLPKRLREEQRRERLEAMIGQQIGLKIIEVDRQRRRLIFSQRRALRGYQEVQRDRVMTELTEGETRHGRVTSITNFGAFVDLGGADGLIHVSELSWGRVDNPRQVLKVGDELDVYVLDVDEKRKRIALSLKKLQPDPWTIVDDHYQMGQLVEGRVTRVLDFGAFVELDIGVEGLLHASEIIGTPELAPSDIVHSGEKLLVKIIRIDSRRKRLALSARQVRQGEWERWVAEQRAETEAKEAAAVEAEAKEAAEAELTVSETVETEVAAPKVETETETSEVTEAEGTVPETELAVSETVETEVAAPKVETETVTSEVTEAEVTAPETELTVSEAVETEVAAPEAKVTTNETVEAEIAAPEAKTVEAETVAPEAELTVNETVEAEITAPKMETETETSEVTEAETAVIEAEATVSETVEEEAIAPEAKTEAETKEIADKVSEADEASDEKTAIAEEPAAAPVPDVALEETDAVH
ncbi:MAG: S1 RNA-binding domain-containing protein [Chloroflexi bacterium]|nr:S1 RNA-binding domain-containing protein [Chloroflexota bacterium]